MAEYKEYIKALRQCAKEHKNDITPTFKIRVSDLCNDTAKLLENDVIERSKIDKAIEEMESIELVMFCDEMRDYCIEILKRNIGE